LGFSAGLPFHDSCDGGGPIFVLKWHHFPFLKLPVLTAILNGRHTSLALSDLCRRSRSRIQRYNEEWLLQIDPRNQPSLITKRQDFFLPGMRRYR
jgi:hypothetical protein